MADPDVVHDGGRAQVPPDSAPAAQAVRPGALPAPERPRHRAAALRHVRRAYDDFSEEGPSPVPHHVQPSLSRDARAAVAGCGCCLRASSTSTTCSSSGTASSRTIPTSAWWTTSRSACCSSSAMRVRGRVASAMQYTVAGACSEGACRARMERPRCSAAIGLHRVPGPPDEVPARRERPMAARARHPNPRPAPGQETDPDQRAAVQQGDAYARDAAP